METCEISEEVIDPGIIFETGFVNDKKGQLFGTVKEIAEKFVLEIWKEESTIELVPENNRCLYFLQSIASLPVIIGFLYEEQGPRYHVIYVEWITFKSKIDRRSSILSLRQESMPRELVRDLMAHFFNPETKSLPKGASYCSNEEISLRAKAYRPSYEKCKAVADWFRVADELEQRANISSSRKRQLKDSRDLLLSIDWRDNPPGVGMNLDNAMKILEKRLYGMREAKETLLEVLAEIKHTGKPPRRPVLLAGPPGTGKTVLAAAVAEILQMPLIEFPMNQENDSLAFTGTSSIYENATYGMFFRQLVLAKTKNVVVFLDEYDQAFEKNRKGENSSCGVIFRKAIEGNGFHEVYLDMVIPTDAMIFIAACNDVSLLPAAERDRFRIISVPGYTAREKTVIERDYILPKMLREKNINADMFRITPEALNSLVIAYSPEPGVRTLEKMTEKLCGRYLVEVESGKRSAEKPYTVTESMLVSILGLPKTDMIVQTSEAGLVNAGVWNDGILSRTTIECRVTEGSGRCVILSAPGQRSREDVRLAYEAARASLGVSFGVLDVIISFSDRDFAPDAACSGNIGIAVFAAIASAVSLLFEEKYTGYDSETIFIGGIDLFGNCFIRRSDMLPKMINQAYDLGMRTIVTGISPAVACKEIPKNMRIIPVQKVTQLLASVLQRDEN